MFKFSVYCADNHLVNNEVINVFFFHITMTIIVVSLT